MFYFRIAEGVKTLLCGFGLGGFLSVEILRQPEWRRGALFHGSLNGFLVAAKRLFLDRIAEIAGLNVQQDLYLPRLERVTVHGAAYQFLDEPVKPGQDHFAVLSLYEHPN